MTRTAVQHDDIDAFSTSLERISGPHRGYYLASYTLPHDGGFIGYTKICQSRPRDIWGCKAIEKVGSLRPAPQEAALEISEALARRAIDAFAAN